MANPYSQEQKALSRESLQEALFSLMRHKQFAAISVSELAAKAGISRMAFYRNYDTKEVVFVDYFNAYIDPFMQFLNGLPDKQPDFISRAYFQYIDDHSELFEVAIRSEAEQVLAEPFTSIVSQFYLDNVETIPFTGDFSDYWNRFISAGLFRMTIDWIKDGKKAPKQTLAEILMRIGG